MKGTDEQILSLAAVLNSPTIAGGATVESADPAVPVDIMVKRHADAICLFAVGMRSAPCVFAVRMRSAPTHGGLRATGEAGDDPADG